MNELTEDDKTYFSNSSNWRLVPMYELNLFLHHEAKLDVVHRIALKAGNFIQWEGFPEGAIKTIARFDGLPSVGLIHTWLDCGETFSYNIYSIKMYQEHCKRALGMTINTYERDEENWNRMEQSKVRLFHAGLFGVIREVNARIEIISASINTENRGMMSPLTRDGSVCISPKLPPILGINSKPIGDGEDYFVKVELHDEWDV
jgi:hypothetical protein